jgi:hypothetical protein
MSMPPQNGLPGWDGRAAMQAAPAVEQGETEVGGQARRVPELLQPLVADPCEASRDLVRRHIHLEDHVAAEQHDGVGKGPAAAVDGVDELVDAPGCTFRDHVVEELDKMNCGRHVQGPEVVTVGMVSQATVIGECQERIVGWLTAVLRDEDLDVLVIFGRNLERTAAQHVSICCFRSSVLFHSNLQLSLESEVFMLADRYTVHFPS